MRPLVFLFPDARTDVGGNLAQMRFMRACTAFRKAHVAYYSARIAGQDHLTDWEARTVLPGEEPIFIVHWGPDVADLIERLEGRDVIYVAHSSGWGMKLPPRVPVLCVSRNTLGYWGRHAPNSYLALLPNIVDHPGSQAPDLRDIDVLVQARKSSHYLLDELVPALRERCRLTLLDGWVDDLGAYLRRSKVYLYDSVEHWISVGATEGFGLPPLEAMAQGCIVFSSINDALADYLDPGFNCRKIRVHSLGYDVEAILRAVAGHAPPVPQEEAFEAYSQALVGSRLRTLLTDIEHFFEVTSGQASTIADPWAARPASPFQRIRRAAKVLALG